MATTHGCLELEHFSDEVPRTDRNGGRPIVRSVQALKNKDNIQSVVVPYEKVRKHLPLQGQVGKVQKTRI